jgi:hypothetical protein
MKRRVRSPRFAGIFSWGGGASDALQSPEPNVVLITINRKR